MKKLLPLIFFLASSLALAQAPAPSAPAVPPGKADKAAMKQAAPKSASTSKKGKSAGKSAS